MSVNSAEIHAAFGATGSGKSIYCKGWLLANKPPRLLIWDSRGEYEQFAKLVPTLADLYKQSKAATFRLRFHPGKAIEQKLLHEKFNVFCEIAATAGSLVVVVEELRTVTQAGWAPRWWRELSGAGRHDRLVIFGMSQRPAAVDKDFISNATYIRTGRLNDLNDVRTLASVLFVDKAKLLALKEREYIHRDTRSGEISTGLIAIPKGLKRPS